MTENNLDTVRLLVVSREPAGFRVLGPRDASQAWHLETASNGWEAMERMQSGVTSHVLVLDIPLLDVPFKDSEPMHFLRWLRSFKPDFPVVLLCCPDDASRVKEATSLGGEDVVFKPFDPKHLENVIHRLLNQSGNGHADTASKNIEQLGHDTCFVSASLMMQKLHAQAALLAKTDVPVLIVGESGAGKYTVASLIHKLSVRSGFKLLRVNCAAMPEAELEAELFGGESVSVSHQTSLGKFTAGEKGTILLEEIAEMPTGVQCRLLQVLQNNELHAPAGGEGMAANVRILATSSANPDRALAEKRLREELYHRLSAFTIQVPPLRQRKDEIATLLRYFMHNLARHYGLPERGFSAGMVAACQRYSWPGNLRELEVFVKRYLVAGDESIFSESAMDLTGTGDNDLVASPLKPGTTRLDESGVAAAKPKPDSLKSMIQAVKWEAERNAIAAALKRTGWNRKAAARLLKVSYRTMLYKIDQYKMRAPQSYFSPLTAGEFPGHDDVKGNGQAR
ncbi:MAG: sigma-54-dependent transcriptional regulator [Candidatus Sulfotelmatobacter sp.]